MESNHKMIQVLLCGCFLLLIVGCKENEVGPPSGPQESIPLIINHQCTSISQIPTSWIDSAKSNLHIAYGHTSHGSQITTGMSSLVGFMNGLGYPQNLYAYNTGGTNGALDLRDYAFSGASDLGNPDRVAWAGATRTYLNAHSEVNVVIWSWCGQVSSATEGDIITYVTLMDSLEREYPAVRFVYMTGHLDGGGSAGNLHVRNQQIRTYCQVNKKILYDFADIESYDPDGQVNYMELQANDNCDYDSDGNGSLDKNWALDWQGTHTENVDWYSCSAAHSQALNGNRKAYAAWWLWARLAGWNEITIIEERGEISPRNPHLSQNYPNPFNPITTIEFSVGTYGHTSLRIYDMLGREIAILVDAELKAGMMHTVRFDASTLSSGMYLYRLQSGNNVMVKKLILMK